MKTNTKEHMKTQDTNTFITSFQQSKYKHSLLTLIHPTEDLKLQFSLLLIDMTRKLTVVLYFKFSYLHITLNPFLVVKVEG